MRALESAVRTDRIVISRYMLALSNCLGHANATETYRYLEVPPSLMNRVSAVSERLHARTGPISGLVAPLSALPREDLWRDRGVSPHPIASYAASFKRLVVFTQQYALSVSGRPSRHHHAAPQSQSPGDGPGQRCVEPPCVCPRSSSSSAT